MESFLFFRTTGNRGRLTRGINNKIAITKDELNSRLIYVNIPGYYTEKLYYPN